ncbi:MAG: hypothetical protein B7Y80_17715 [Hyphomicrobium sp. 32-62-53]|nr:MAG: hypothetical protein B7Z29_17090 [Hyphomicrobium sp. 12-62-95]OYX97986.1 MAG: hypothetical protein B7Y80_17715 [Hyphomicrobium sp. 32-62-53]
MATIKHFGPFTPAEKLIEALTEDGCVVIDTVLPPERHAKLKRELNQHLDAIPDCQGDFYGYATKRLGLLFNKSDVFQEMALVPSILAVMDHYLLPSCSQYQINLTQAISIGPNEPRQIMHQDDPMFPFLHPGQEVMLNCMWAIDDFTETNGSTVLVPGSHKWPRQESLNLALNDLPPEQIALGTMKAGSVLIYLGSLFHCGGRNETQTRRCGAVISYSLGWLRQAENAYLGYSLEDLEAMPDKLQELVGYFVHKPNLGSINGVHPLEFVKNPAKLKLFTEFLPEAVKPFVKEFRDQSLTKNAA